jgi:hypothetical protein
MNFNMHIKIFSLINHVKLWFDRFGNFCVLPMIYALIRFYSLVESCLNIVEFGKNVELIFLCVIFLKLKKLGFPGFMGSAELS